MAETKHELILNYIEALPVNTRVSVRLIAKELNVSEGTAYRAIKQAENAGLVNSIPKVGTIRIETAKKRRLEDMTLSEIAYITESVVLSGEANCTQIPKAFAVCFSARDAREKKRNASRLIITTADTDVFSSAVECNAAILLANGIQPDAALLQKYREQESPVLLSSYDAFEIISMINRAISERQVQQNLMHIEDVMTTHVDTLYAHDTVADWKELTLKLGHTNFPVINGERKLLGVVTPLSVTGVGPKMPISEVMETDSLVVQRDTLVSHVSRLLVWEDCDIVPVVDEENTLVGVVSRQDMIQTLQETQKQPQFGETVDNLTLSGFKLMESEDNRVTIAGRITQFMMNESHQASVGAISMLVGNAATIAAHKLHRVQTVAEQIYLNCLEPVQLDEEVTVEAVLLKTERHQLQVEVSIRTEQSLKYRASLVLQVVKGK